MMAFYILLALVLLSFALLPAAIRTGYCVTEPVGQHPLCIVVATTIIITPIVIAFVASLIMNEIWYRAIHWR